MTKKKGFIESIFSMFSTESTTKPTNKNTDTQKSTATPTKNRSSDADLITGVINSMTNAEFGRLCFLYFQAKNFRPERIKQNGAYMTVRSSSGTTTVQCKRWSAKKRIGPVELEKLYEAMKQTDSKKGIFITTNDFTNDSIDYAAHHNIELWNEQKTIHILESWRNK